VITGVHAIIFSEQADEVRDFVRDVLGFPSVDAGGGWLIFGLPPAELAAHPTEGTGHHQLHLICDDIRATVAELGAKGVEFGSEVTEQRFGLITSIKLPGGGELPLYEPRHPRPPAPAARPTPGADGVDLGTIGPLVSSTRQGIPTHGAGR
jgi:catechol 2,3-dioxygenase-like lactoylglutathione lyase family enzyme